QNSETRFLSRFFVTKRKTRRNRVSSPPAREEMGTVNCHNRFLLISIEQLNYKLYCYTVD
ncbi:MULTISPECIES: hypothetical protein, partial [unclassified Microcoleus]|uniref:hypothetical protein n=1 Tax=unclassified Microcoleus TaxID=2642155 RepID=UPI0025F4313E